MEVESPVLRCENVQTLVEFSTRSLRQVSMVGIWVSRQVFCEIRSRPESQVTLRRVGVLENFMDTYWARLGFIRLK
jgi:hypothetical protein